MVEELVERNLSVAASDGPREAGARGCQRLKAEVGEEPGAARIPGIRNDEAPGLVECVEGAATVVRELSASGRSRGLKVACEAADTTG